MYDIYALSVHHNIYKIMQINTKTICQHAQIIGFFLNIAFWQNLMLNGHLIFGWQAASKLQLSQLQHISYLRFF